MTPEAARALARNDVSRRDFLAGSGALIVAFCASGPLERELEAQGQFGTRASHVDPQQLDSWIAVAADGGVSAFTGKCELGQGMLTAQTQLVAEELSVPISQSSSGDVRYGRVPGSGHDLRQPVHSDEFQRWQPGACGRDSARSARDSLPPRT